MLDKITYIGYFSVTTITFYLTQKKTKYLFLLSLIFCITNTFTKNNSYSYYLYKIIKRTSVLKTLSIQDIQRSTLSTSTASSEANQIIILILNTLSL